MNQNPKNKPTMTACFVIALVAALAAPALPASAAVTSPNVVAFFAAPALINLNQTTSVTLDIEASAGAGEDNYLVSVLAPNGAVAATLWYNFTSLGSKTFLLGNATLDFQAQITEAGFYTLKAEWWNSTSTAFEPAAEGMLQTTDVLYVATEFAEASNPYTDAHNCPLAEEFQRGDEVIARGWIRYASSGAVVNSTLVPTAAGNVTGTLFGATKNLTYNKEGFWRTAWFIPWDSALGTFPFTVSASDGAGNHGTGVSPPTGGHGALRVIPAVLKTSVWTANATSGLTSAAFYPGESVQIVARSTYELHNAHNYIYTNSNATAKNFSYPVGPDRSGVAVAAIGTGAYNATSGQYANNLANVTLAFDAATGTWRGTWPVSSGSPLGANLSLAVKVTDGAPTANLGRASVTFAALPLPAPEVITNTVTVYNNTTLTVFQDKIVEVAKAGTMDSTLGYGLLVVGLAAGVGAGFALLRRGGGKGPESAGAPSEAKPAKDEKQGKKKDEGWG